VKIRGTLSTATAATCSKYHPAVDAVTVMPGDVPALLRIAGHAEVRGEVIDPKHYIGAMKPGGGKTHKACAELCLAGGYHRCWPHGMPAAMKCFNLLIMPDGTPANSKAAPFAGETVTVSGSVEKRDDLLILRLGGRLPKLNVASPIQANRSAV